MTAEERCCPGAGTMAHVRGCANHPEAQADAAERHGRPDGCRPGDGCPCYPIESDVEALASALMEHEGCQPNAGQDNSGSGTTGVGVWSCGIRVPFVDNLDTMERLHLAAALETLLSNARRVAWDAGALAVSEGRGSDANPYARWTR